MVRSRLSGTTTTQEMSGASGHRFLGALKISHTSTHCRAHPAKAAGPSCLCPEDRTQQAVTRIIGPRRMEALDVIPAEQNALVAASVTRARSYAARSRAV